MYNTVSPNRLRLNYMQKIEFIGNLGSNPVEKNFENGKIAEFSVGVTEREFKTKDGKTIPATTEWFRCVARNALADVVMNTQLKVIRFGWKLRCVPADILTRTGLSAM